MADCRDQRIPLGFEVVLARIRIGQGVGLERLPDHRGLGIASRLAAELDRLGKEVLLDDRTVSPGVKFKDAELLGMPWIVVVGRGWADGIVELRNRFSGASREIPVDGAATELVAALAL